MVDDPDLAALSLPGYRADLAILEEYADPRLPPLDRPIVVVTGDRDEPGPDALAGWHHHTTANCTVRVLAGGHFPFRDHPGPYLDLLRELLAGPVHASTPEPT
jgi:medium-chain acyl-[acyl-carrier-protein] hydrolase